MTNSGSERTLTRAGFSLIFLALVTGFVIPNFANPRMALAAHMTGVLNGLLLVAISFVWSQLALSPGQSQLAKGAALFATYVNWATSCLAADPQEKRGGVTLMKGIVLAAVGLSLGLGASAIAEMNPRLEPLRPLVGKTYRGTFPSSTPEKPVVDVQRFELALNGQAVRTLHSINDGAYGGETLIVWDEEKKSLVSYYFTTAGFYTVGQISVEGGDLVFHDVVRNAAGGITEVRSRGRVLEDGRLHVKAEHLKNGQWVPARELDYVPDPNAVVRFKD